MTTRRAFLAAAFGAATARGTPKYFPMVLRNHVTLAEWISASQTVNWEPITGVILIDPRQAQARIDFLKSYAY